MHDPADDGIHVHGLEQHEHEACRVEVVYEDGEHAAQLGVGLMHGGQEADVGQYESYFHVHVDDARRVEDAEEEEQADGDGQEDDDQRRRAAGDHRRSCLLSRCKHILHNKTIKVL